MKMKGFKTSEDDHINWLCDRIQEEIDYSQFSALVRELNEMLERKNLPSKSDRRTTEKVA